MSNQAMMRAPSLPPMQGGGAPWSSGKYSARTFFTYESDTTASLAPAASATLTFNIAGDSDFFWTKFTATCDVGGAATTRETDQLPAVTLLLVNTTTGRQYSSAPVPLANMSGTGSLPFIIPMITLWEKKSTIQLQLLNYGNATYSTLHMSFMGIKAFTAPGA
jgi:hypothetical protein